MTAAAIVALIIAMPLILLPVAFIWYLNIAGFIGLIREHREETAKVEKGSKAPAGLNA